MKSGANRFQEPRLQMIREIAAETLRILAIVAVLALVAWLALRSNVAPPLVVTPTPAEAKTWREVWNAPPQFCPTPQPVCPGGKCPMKPRSVA